MDKKTEALKQALEALEAMQSYAAAERKGLRICDEAIAALRAALAQPQQEPVACKTLCELCVKRGYIKCANAAKTTPIPSPQPAQQQEPVALDPKDVHVEVVTKQMGGFAPVMTNGIRLTHKPTGIVVEETEERSAHRNRHVAWERLARLVASPQPSKPLTDEQIEREWQFLHDEEGNPPDQHDFARAIEAAHGIKE